MTLHYNKTIEKPKRKSLRHNMTQPEVILWSKLKGNNIGGHKFRRQYSVDQFVLDFYCPQLKIAIEVDGESHVSNDAMEYDHSREEHIKQFGIMFLRFTNNDVRNNLSGVLNKILETVREREKSLLSPPYQGGD